MQCFILLICYVACCIWPKVANFLNVYLQSFWLIISQIIVLLLPVCIHAEYTYVPVYLSIAIIKKASIIAICMRFACLPSNFLYSTLCIYAYSYVHIYVATTDRRCVCVLRVRASMYIHMYVQCTCTCTREKQSYIIRSRPIIYSYQHNF